MANEKITFFAYLSCYKIGQIKMTVSDEILVIN